MKHEARSTKFETNSKVKKFQIGSSVLNFRIFPPEADPPLAENLDIVSDFGFRISDFHRKSRGFTMVEIVIMLGIIVLVSAVVLVNFPAVTETIFIQRSGQEISGLLRRAQSMSLAVRSVRDPVTGLPRVPRGVGVQFLNNSSTAVLFGELSVPPNWFYDVGIDAVIATYILERNVQTTLSTPTRPPGPVPGQAHVVFMAPDASISILGDSTADNIGQTDGRASIRMVTQKLSLDRTVEVSITGQISVK